MKRLRFLSVGLMGLSLVGLISVVNPTNVILAEEKVVTHEHVDEPTQVLMNEIAKRVNNILDGILAGSFKYVAQEAGAVVDHSYKINATFFPVDPKENKWFKRAKIDPNDSEKITRLKEEFNGYLKGIATSALAVQKAAASNNQEATFKSFINMVEKTCFECHNNVRDKQIPIENR
ncbi:MAG: cytochrome c [Candidatus Brocadiales bacterium]|nr:cytochrome c [Candidatus Brocadiales bacterium]